MGKAARANAKRNGVRPLMRPSDHRIQLSNPVSHHFPSFIFGNATMWETMALQSLREANPNIYEDLQATCALPGLTLIERARAGFEAIKRAGSCTHVAEEGSAKGQHLVLCGAGPSLRQYLDLTATADQVWGCNSAMTYLYNQGAKVTHGFTVDQTPVMLKEWYTTPPVEYLIATTCHPHLAELLMGRRRPITFFHNYVGIRDREPVNCDGELLPYEDWLYSVFFPTTVRVGSGLNSVNRAVDLALWMGFGKITILGADCSIAFSCPPPKPPQREMTELEYYTWINGPVHRAWLANETQMHADGGSATANDQSNVTLFGEVDGRPWLTKPDLIVSAVWLEKQRQMHPEIEIVGDTLPQALKDKPDDYLRQLPTMVDAAGRTPEMDLTPIALFHRLSHIHPNWWAVPTQEQPVADPKTYTQDEYDALNSQLDKLKSKRDELLQEAKDAKKALGEYEGLDPKTAKALKKSADDAEAAAAAARGDFSAREKQLIDANRKELDARDVKISKRDQVIQRRVAQDELRKAITKAGGDADLLLPHATPFVKVRETDDDFEAYLEEKGQPIVSDGRGTPMSFDVFVAERLKPKFPGAFAGTGSSGSGATRSVASGAGVRVIPAGQTWTKADIDDVAAGKARVAGG